MLNKKFDQLLSFLNDLTKTEFFTNLNYVNYIENKTIGKNYREIDDFKAINEFKNCINLFELTNKKLKILEQEYLAYRENLDNFIKDYNLK